MMPTGLLLITLFTYGFALWLGFYLIMRDPQKPRLHLAGWGLIAYGLALGVDLLRLMAAVPLSVVLARLHAVLIILPALLWAGAVLYLLPADVPGHRALRRGWTFGLLPLTLLLLLILAGSDLPLGVSADASGGMGWLVVALVGLPLVAVLILVLRHARRIGPGQVTGLLIGALLFFGLGMGLLLFPLNLLPRRWLTLGIGFDLVLLGIIVAVFDAFDEGEVLLPDMARSFDASLLLALVFGLQVALAMSLIDGSSVAMFALLLGVIATAILLQTTSDALQTLLDRVTFAAFSTRRREREVLRAAVRAEARVDHSFAESDIDPEKFDKLTRRALSHMGDLPRLARSPLTRLPLIDRRLAKRDVPATTLERAAELKALLAESIQRLKPRGKGDFGTADEWRYYNALYFPYVVGLRPYSRRYTPDGELSETERDALDWFRAQVPERTLYNWQSAAAELVAQDLRDRLAKTP